MDTLIDIQRHLILHSREGEVVSPLPGLRISRSRSVGLPTSAIQEPCVSLIAQGAKRTEIGDIAFEFQEGETLVVPANLPIVGQITKASARAPYLAMAFALRPEVIAELLATQPLATSSPGVQTGPSPSSIDPALLDAFNRLLALVDNLHDANVLLPMLEREIAWRLLHGSHAWLVRQIGQERAQSSRVGNVVRWICEHHSEPVSIDALAEMAGMSVFTFYRQFRAITATSPLQYQKQIRLQEARMLLLKGESDAVTAAYAVGYQSQSQFSREYRRRFGLPPMQDVQRTRAERSRALDVI